MADGPLQGIRILDLTHVWAGPLGVRLLADLGADVVRVEAPASRGPQRFPAVPIGGFMGGQPGEEPWNASASFVKLMRNRRSFCVDLKQTAGREAFLSLVGVADVVVENFSPRAMVNLGLSYPVMRDTNPRIIYLSMPGFGVGGPRENRVAFGPTVESMSGFSTMLGYGSGEPRNSAIALPDPIAAVHAAAAITHAVRERHARGRGRHIELTLYESAIAYNGPWLIDEQRGDTPRCHGGAHPGMAPHGCFRCAGEDEWVFVACADQAQWTALWELLQAQPDGVQLNRAWSLEQRQQYAPAIACVLGVWLLAIDKHSACERLQTAGVSAGPVNTTPDMVADPQVRSRGFFVDCEPSHVPLPGNAMKMSGVDAEHWTPCPRLGEHNEAVLRDWLGLDASEIDTLSASGALADKPPG